MAETMIASSYPLVTTDGATAHYGIHLRGSMVEEQAELLCDPDVRGMTAMAVRRASFDIPPLHTLPLCSQCDQIARDSR